LSIWPFTYATARAVVQVPTSPVFDKHASPSPVTPAAVNELLSGGMNLKTKLGDGPCGEPEFGSRIPVRKQPLARPTPILARIDSESEDCLDSSGECALNVSGSALPTCAALDWSYAQY
jgi:hypothetical protein